MRRELGIEVEGEDRDEGGGGEMLEVEGFVVFGRRKRF